MMVAVVVLVVIVIVTRMKLTAVIKGIVVDVISSNGVAGAVLAGGSESGSSISSSGRSNSSSSRVGGGGGGNNEVKRQHKRSCQELAGRRDKTTHSSQPHSGTLHHRVSGGKSSSMSFLLLGLKQVQNGLWVNTFSLNFPCSSASSTLSSRGGERLPLFPLTPLHYDSTPAPRRGRERERE